MDVASLSYLAGIIDADGCILIHRSTYNMNVLRNTLVPMYQVRLYISQVEPHAINLAKSLFGGHVGRHSKRTGNRRPLFLWRITSSKACRAIRDLLPYLRIKKPQAENALRLDELNGQKRWPRLDVKEGEPMVTGTEFAAMVGAKQKTILQGCRTGAIPNIKQGKYRMVPVSFSNEYRSRRAAGGFSRRSAAVNAAMEECFLIQKALNHVGVRPPSDLTVCAKWMEISNNTAIP